jgi:hypothetical protein
MEKSDLVRMEALKNICNRLVMKLPDAIGMAMIELDCGCVNICGVSIRGEPVGSINTIVTGSETGDTKSPICNRCLTSKGRISGRVVNERMIWPGDVDEQPDRDLRLFIGRKVFGEDYLE